MPGCGPYSCNKIQVGRESTGSEALGLGESCTGIQVKDGRGGSRRRCLARPIHPDSRSSRHLQRRAEQ